MRIPMDTRLVTARLPTELTVHPRAAFLHDPPPLLEFAADVGPELLGALRYRLDAGRGEAT
jgi:hypothetical protein